MSLNPNHRVNKTWFSDRFVSTNPPLWEEKQKKHGLNRQQTESIADQCKLLELIQQHPDRPAGFYSQQIGRSPHWVRATLSEYHDAEVVAKIKTETDFIWRLT